MVDGGCDVVEVGLPYSDPVLDGPTIQAAAEQALRQGTRIADVLHTVEAVTAAGATAVVMTYWNPVQRYGVDRFARDLAAAGGAGLITPDLTPDEAAGVAGGQRRGRARPDLPRRPEHHRRPAGHDHRRLPRVRLRRLGDGRDRRPGRDQPGRTRARAPHPRGHRPAGLRRPRASPPRAQAAEVASYADGVIVGSAFVRAVLDAPDLDAATAALRRLAGSWPAGCVVRRSPSEVVAVTERHAGAGRGTLHGGWALGMVCLS